MAGHAPPLSTEYRRRTTLLACRANYFEYAAVSCVSIVWNCSCSCRWMTFNRDFYSLSICCSNEISEVPAGIFPLAFYFIYQRIPRRYRLISRYYIGIPHSAIYSRLGCSPIGSVQWGIRSLETLELDCRLRGYDHSTSRNWSIRVGRLSSCKIPRFILFDVMPTGYIPRAVKRR